MADLDTMLMDDLSFLYPNYTGNEPPIASDNGEQSYTDFDVLLDEVPFDPWGDSFEVNNGNLVLQQTETPINSGFNFDDDDKPHIGASVPTYGNQENLGDDAMAFQNVSWATILEANAAYDDRLALSQNASTFEGLTEFLVPANDCPPEQPAGSTLRDFDMLDQVDDQLDHFENLPLIQTPENRAHFGSGFPPFHYDVTVDSSSNPAQCFTNFRSQPNLSGTSHEHEAQPTFQFVEETDSTFGNGFEGLRGIRLPLNRIEEQNAITQQARESGTDGDHSDALKVRKRRWTRRTITQIETGNNAFGRKGTLRCEACRNRNSRCIFLHKWLPCEFCALRKIPTPCIKKWGKRKEEKLGLSWPLPVPDDVQMNSVESLLFHYALSDEFLLQNGSIAQVLRGCVAGYGGAIPSSSLRYAVFAWAAKCLPSALFETQMEDNKLLCYRALKERKHESDNADLFATYLLASMACNPSEMWEHLRSILTFLNWKPLYQRTSFRMFIGFKHLLHVILNFTTGGEDGSRRLHYPIVWFPGHVDGVLSDPRPVPEYESVDLRTFQVSLIIRS